MHTERHAVFALHRCLSADNVIDTVDRITSSSQPSYTVAADLKLSKIRRETPRSWRRCPGDSVLTPSNPDGFQYSASCSSSVTYDTQQTAQCSGPYVDVASHEQELLSMVLTLRTWVSLSIV